MRIILALAISLQSLLLVPPAAVAQQAQIQQEARLPEPRPRLIPGTVGQGPLALVSSAAVTYQEYFAHGCPLVLTVDAFGWTTHAALGTTGPCPETVDKIPQDTMRGALNACEANSHTPPCSVVAVGRKIVWDGPIRFVPGRYVPHDDRQASIVLRKIPTEDMESTTLETSVGLITYRADGRSADIAFQRHDELGVCRGTLTAPSDGAAAPIALTCTKANAIFGTVTLKPEDGAGTGSASNGQSQFALTILPKAVFLKSGTLIYEPAPKGGSASDNIMTKQHDSGAT